jgi:hypothetical protein
MLRRTFIAIAGALPFFGFKKSPTPLDGDFVIRGETPLDDGFVINESAGDGYFVAVAQPPCASFGARPKEEIS